MLEERRLELIPQKNIAVKSGFIVNGHSSEVILLAILEQYLVSQMTDAGYLVGEPAKA